MTARAAPTPAESTFLAHARTATLATIAPDGRPRLVPVCFVLVGTTVYTPLDEKPKAVSDPRSLARVRDIERRPDVTLLVDRWAEDWTRLAWLRCQGRAELIEADAAPAEHRAAVAALRAKYPQYDTHDLESRPLIRITIDGVVSWGAIEGRERLT